MESAIFFLSQGSVVRRERWRESACSLWCFIIKLSLIYLSIRFEIQMKKQLLFSKQLFLKLRLRERDNQEFNGENPESPTRQTKQIKEMATPKKKNRAINFVELSALNKPSKKTNLSFFCSSMRSTTPSRFQSEYECIKRLGCGHFGQVLQCKNIFDQKTYALKHISTYTSSALNEVKTLAKISTNDQGGQFIVKYFCAWIEQEGLYIAMEYCPSSLKKQMWDKAADEDYFCQNKIIKIIKDLLRGLALLHKQNIVHLDIKPQNILISASNHYKIGDLGLSKLVSNKNEVNQGDSRYMAKQLLSLQTKVIDLFACDIFSLGISILQIMLKIQMPFNGQAWHNYRSGFKLSEQKSLQNKYSGKLLKVIDSMLQVQRRPSAKQLLSSQIFSIGFRPKIQAPKRKSSF